MSPRELIVEADGGSRGNPGVAGYGALVRDRQTGSVLAERAEPLGKASNNVAEYSGLIAGLRAAYALEPGADIEVRMDSKLVIEQMAGRWKIKHEDMRRLALEACDVATQISAAGGSVSWTWIPRERNKDADALSNVGMDGHVVDRVLSESSDGLDDTARDADVLTTWATARVVFVCATDSAAPQAAAAVSHLIGGHNVRVYAAPGGANDVTAAALQEALDVDVSSDPRFDSSADEVLEALRSVTKDGGIAVIIASPVAIRHVLAHVLDASPQGVANIALTPGSLSALEFPAPDRATVVFINRL